MKFTSLKRWMIGSLTCFMMASQSMPAIHANGLDWLVDKVQPNSNVEQTQDLTQEDIDIIVRIYNIIKYGYIEDIDKKTLLQGALKGMVTATDDPYSEFLTEVESQVYDETVEGSFEGVGIQFMPKEGGITVITAVDGSPAFKAGIQPNDLIIQADGKDLTGLSTSEVMELIRGPKGEEVTLTIQRADDTFDVKLVRDEIPIVTVTGEIDDEVKDIAHVKITQFNGTTYEELKDTIESMRKKGAHRFIFDVRYNPGGLLDQALKISNMFLKDDENIMQMQEVNADPFIYKASDKDYGDFQVDEPYVVLINDGSASASEIFAAAIKENTEAPIVGITSFGKGTVQTMGDSSYLGELKLTYAKWLTPKGLWIHETGIEPTVKSEPEKIESVILLDAKTPLKKGDASLQTESLGIMLEALGYLKKPQTYFDDQMEAAVKSYQKEHQLDQTGIVEGDTTYQLLEDVQTYFKEHDAQYEDAKETLLQYTSKEEAA